jgi:methyl-accepting chemotaxis protein
MSWFRNLRTMTKLLIAFGLLSGVMLGVGYFGASGMVTTQELLDELYERDLVGLNAVKDAQIARLTIGRDMRDAMVNSDPGKREKALRSLEEQDAAFRGYLDTAEQTLSTAEDKAALAAIRQGYEPLVAASRATARAAAADDAVAAREGYARQQELIGALREGFDTLKGNKLKQARAAHEQSREISGRLHRNMVLLTIVGILFGIVSAVVVGRAIGAPLGRAVVVLEDMARGDFTRALYVDSSDEIGKLGRAMNSAVVAVREALNGVRAVADQVAASSNELSATAQEIASGAQEQAASLEETAASLEEITSTVKQTGDNAQQASRLASSSRDVAEKGGRTVRSAVDAMSEITQSSKQIAAIITTIDEIAFQTNLLALNAAVEAARAGEQGRGFAVVATEVRHLAQRSAAASKEIKGLIGSSVRKVELGSAHVTMSGTTLEEIVGSVKHVTNIVAEIAAATREQNTGLDQVNKAVSQLDQVTQSNAAQTEELSATAESLSEQARQLQVLVAKFKTGAESQAGARTVGATTRAKPLPESARRLPKAPIQRFHDKSTRRVSDTPNALANGISQHDKF